MSGLILENVEKHYGSACAVKDETCICPRANWCVPRPVGLRQNHLLRMIAGLETLTGGEIRLDGEHHPGARA